MPENISPEAFRPSSPTAFRPNRLSMTLRPVCACTRTARTASNAIAPTIKAVGQLLLDDLGRWGNAGNRLQTADAVAAYFQSRITFKSAVLSPGLRLERIRQDRTRWETRADRTTDPADRSLDNLRDQRRNKVQVLLPGVGLLWPLSPAVSVVAGVHRGFTTPSNAPGVEPETALNYELGFRTSGRTALEAIYFLSDYDNLLGQCTASSGAQCTSGRQLQRQCRNGSGP